VVLDTGICSIELCKRQKYSPKTRSWTDLLIFASSMKKAPNDEIYSYEETAARREAALKRVFAMPHKPHGPIGKRTRVESGKKD